MPFLSFREITYTCLLQMSIAHNKNLNALLSLHIDCISARSAPQTLSTNGDCTFLLLNFSNNWFAELFC